MPLNINNVEYHQTVVLMALVAFLVCLNGILLLVAGLRVVFDL